MGYLSTIFFLVVVTVSGCCEPQQYQCCTSDADCCTDWGKLECSVGVCVFPGASNSTSSSQAVLFLKHIDGAAEKLKAELLRRSDPDSDIFLSWLSRDEVRSILQPNATHFETVAMAVAEHGAQLLSAQEGDDKVTVQFPGPMSPGFLKAVEPAVDWVSHSSAQSPLDVSMPLRHRVVKGEVKPVQEDAFSQSCLSSLDGVTPTCLRSAYGITGGAKKPSTARGQAFIVNQGFHPSDIAQFQRQYKLPNQPVARIVGSNPGNAGDEASLDGQYIMTTGQYVTTTYVYLDGSMDNPFTNWLVWAAKEPDATIAKVHSLSLGAPENEVGDSIIGRMNTEMAALGLRGITILFASGDSGYQPQQKFGAASPFVTAVGGIWNGEMRDSVLQSDELSTGGFAASSQNKAGTWQAAAIASYMKTFGQRPAHIDTSQRAVPDLSAYDDDINIVQNGGNTALSGTSAACPMVAGMMAMINDALAAAGHNTTLGFVNPFLYANEAAFLDITKGNNRGIQAVKGYDPISGLGTFSTTTLDQLTTAALKALSSKKRSPQ